ncbi:unnamed protein product, partial [Larinioides sclopetarius]
MKLGKQVSYHPFCSIRSFIVTVICCGVIPWLDFSRTKNPEDNSRAQDESSADHEYFVPLLKCL